jgi:hypothetical protein
MMGGCYAQEDDSSVVDSYWPAAEILLPATASVYYYWFPELPAGVELADCVAESSHRQMTKGVSSFFTLYQSGKPVIAAYTNYSVDAPLMDIQTTYANGSPNLKRIYISELPLLVDFYFRDGEGSIPAYNLRNNEVRWDSSRPGDQAVFVRGNTAETLFFYSKGSWGLRWYVLPMKSVQQERAVFDFEQKVLVEL